MRVFTTMAACFLLVGSVDAAPPRQEVTTDYHWQTWVADGVSLGLILGGGTAEGPGGEDTTASDVLFDVGFSAAFFGSPLIHLVHGNLRQAGESVALRLGMTSLGMLVAMVANDGCDAGLFCELEYVGYGALGGIVAASLLDAALITHEPAASRTWTPQLAAGHGGLRVGAAFSW